MPGDELFGPEQLGDESTDTRSAKAEMFGPEQLAASPDVVPAAEMPLKDKPIPDQPAPMRERQEFLRRRAPNLTEEGINAANKTAAENAGLAIATEGAGEAVAPVARFAAENILPAAEHVPWIGRGIKAAEEAPTWFKAAMRGGTTGELTGAATGGYETLRTGNPADIARGALYGGAGGALAGVGAYGIGKFARPDFENVPFAGEREPPTTQPFQGAPLPETLLPSGPPVSVRRGPGEIATEHLDQPPEERIPPFPGRNNANLPGGGVILRPTPLLPGKTISPIDALGQQLEQSTGYKPPIPNVPLREQPFRARPVGADVLVSARPEVQSLPQGPVNVPPRAAVIPRPPLGSRVAVPISEEFGPMTKAEGKFPAALTEEPARQMGVEPSPKSQEQMALEKKYPDKATRQMVHANGERMVDAIGDDPETMRDVHNLTGPDVAKAAMNAGMDMKDLHVGSRKLMGSGQISRQELFNRLLDKGFTPREIVELAREK